VIWAGSFDDAAERLHFYNDFSTALTVAFANDGARLPERSIWTGIKAVYSSLIARSPAWEIAETFFNSLTRACLPLPRGTAMNLSIPISTRRRRCSDHYRKIYRGQRPARTPVFGDDGRFDETADDLRKTAKLATARIEVVCGGKTRSLNWRLSRVFFTADARYLVGRVLREGQLPLPIALCLRHENERGIILDALLHGDVDLASCFRLPVPIFRVAVECPYRSCVIFSIDCRATFDRSLQRIGFHRHGKTEFYRDFIAHLRKSTDCFVVADGAREW